LGQAVRTLASSALPGANLDAQRAASDHPGEVGGHLRKLARNRGLHTSGVAGAKYVWYGEFVPEKRMDDKGNGTEGIAAGDPIEQAFPQSGKRRPRRLGRKADRGEQGKGTDDAVSEGCSHRGP